MSALPQYRLLRNLPSRDLLAASGLFEGRESQVSFFATSEALLGSPREYRQLAELGFEIGSCALDGFTDDAGDLPNWTIEMVMADLRDAKDLLEEVLPGASSCSFLMPGSSCLCLANLEGQELVPYLPAALAVFGRVLQVGGDRVGLLFDRTAIAQDVDVLVARSLAEAEAIVAIQPQR